MSGISVSIAIHSGIVENESLLARIACDPEVCHGKPRIRGSRIMVWQALDLLARGEIPGAICSEEYFPDITPQDVRACVAYANQYVKNQEVHPVAAPSPPPREGPAGPLRLREGEEAACGRRP